MNDFIPNDWDAIRTFYALWNPLILVECSDEWAMDPYEWEIMGAIHLTPIERWLWHDIRKHNAVLYPQYPVGRFFVDFANPVAKVAIECDGEAYHQDKARDASRDEELRAKGWRVYRITGRDCRSEFNEETMERGASDLFLERICERNPIKRGSTGCVSDSGLSFGEELMREYAIRDAFFAKHPRYAMKEAQA
jgi:very-short-patch-repair endonuclease